jgi:hypothetical protein
MVMYQYKMVDAGYLSIEETIATEAAAGWRLVAVAPGANLPYKAFFEREQPAAKLEGQTALFTEADDDAHLDAQDRTAPPPWSGFCKCPSPSAVIGSKSCYNCGLEIKR